MQVCLSMCDLLVDIRHEKVNESDIFLNFAYIFCLLL